MERASPMRRDNQDRISSLPDCLLHLIMSFLTADEAVQTCILSQRWKNLWTTLPFLKFDLDRNWYDIETKDDGPDCYYRMFRNFVSLTLLLREPTDLLKFRLSCSHIRDGRYNKFISAWIRYALKHNPQVLDISVCGEDSLPLGLFNCTSLVDLSLHFSYSCHFPVVNLPCINQLHLHHLNLPCIKRLHLRYLYLNQEFMKKLLCGCPVLEFLYLHKCNTEFSSIQSQSLKYLKIEDNVRHLLGATTLELINAPNLYPSTTMDVPITLDTEHF